MQNHNLRRMLGINVSQAQHVRYSTAIPATKRKIPISPILSPRRKLDPKKHRMADVVRQCEREIALIPLVSVILHLKLGASLCIPVRNIAFSRKQLRTTSLIATTAWNKDLSTRTIRNTKSTTMS